jgi:tight adherence protein B
VKFLLQGICIVLAFSWAFYDSIVAALVLSPIAFLWTVLQKKAYKKRRCRLFGMQFRDLIYSVLTGLKAGYSIENAFAGAKKDIAMLYGRDSEIYRYLEMMIKGMANNIPLEKLLQGLGKESENADIQDFAAVFKVAKRNGGNMTEIIERTINVISQKINVEKEIDVLVSAKRLEARIMYIVPFFIIFYINITSPGFFDVLYHNTFGVILMSACLVVYMTAFCLSERIVDIDV